MCWIFDLIAQWHKWKRHIIKCRRLKYHPIYMKDQSNILEYLNKQFDSKTFSMSLASLQNVRCSLSVGTKPSQAQSRLTPGEILENKGNIDCAPTNGSRKTQTRAIFEPLLGNSIYNALFSIPSPPFRSQKEVLLCFQTKIGHQYHCLQAGCDMD